MIFVDFRMMYFLSGLQLGPTSSTFDDKGTKYTLCTHELRIVFTFMEIINHPRKYHPGKYPPFPNDFGCWNGERSQKWNLIDRAFPRGQKKISFQKFYFFTWKTVFWRYLIPWCRVVIWLQHGHAWGRGARRYASINFAVLMDRDQCFAATFS